MLRHVMLLLLLLLLLLLQHLLLLLLIHHVLSNTLTRLVLVSRRTEREKIKRHFLFKEVLFFRNY